MKVIFVDDGVERESRAPLNGKPPKTLIVPVIDHWVEEQYRTSSGKLARGRIKPVCGQRIYQLREIRDGAAVYA